MKTILCKLGFHKYIYYNLCLGTYQNRICICGYKEYWDDGNKGEIAHCDGKKWRNKEELHKRGLEIERIKYLYNIK